MLFSRNKTWYSMSCLFPTSCSKKKLKKSPLLEFFDKRIVGSYYLFLRTLVVAEGHPHLRLDISNPNDLFGLQTVALVRNSILSPNFQDFLKTTAFLKVKNKSTAFVVNECISN